jgi:hypothetical protein
MTTMAKMTGTGAKAPEGAKSSDGGGERSTAMTNGVGMGKADGAGRASGGKERGEYNSGRSESVCYSHKKGC